MRMRVECGTLRKRADSLRPTVCTTRVVPSQRPVEFPA